MKKKLVVVLLSAAMCVAALGGCGSKAGSSSDSSKKTVENSSKEDDQKAADEVAKKIDAIYVQERNDKTDEQCKEAKEAWDKLTDHALSGYFPDSRHLSSGRSCNGRRWRYL